MIVIPERDAATPESILKTPTLPPPLIVTPAAGPVIVVVRRRVTQPSPFPLRVIVAAVVEDGRIERDLVAGELVGQLDGTGERQGRGGGDDRTSPVDSTTRDWPGPRRYRSRRRGSARAGRW